MSLRPRTPMAGLALAGCVVASCAPQSRTLDLPPAAVSELAVEMERALRNDVGKRIDNGVTMSRVSRVGSRLSLGFSVSDPGFLSVAETSGPRALARRVDAMAEEQFCADPLLANFINSGLALDMTFFDQAGQQLFSSSITRC